MINLFHTRRRALIALGAATLSSGMPTLAVAQSTPKVALVLGSGAARGFAHIGVIQALEAAKIKVDMVVGTSAGAVIGAFYAAGFNAKQMEEIALTVKDIDIVDVNSGGTRGMVSGQTLQSFINKHTHDRLIESLQIPFIAVATLLRSGEIATFRKGDLGFAVRASASVPGVFMPAKLNDVEYLDGGLVSPVPVRIARQAGASFVIAVDVSSGPLNAQPISTYEQLMHSFDIMGRSLSKMESDLADVVIRPDVTRIASTDFNARAHFIQLGLDAGTRFAPVVREKLAKHRGR